jgi:hypothetical protein
VRYMLLGSPRVMEWFQFNRGLCPAGRAACAACDHFVVGVLVSAG